MSFVIHGDYFNCSKLKIGNTVNLPNGTLHYLKYNNHPLKVLIKGTSSSLQGYQERYFLNIKLDTFEGKIKEMEQTFSNIFKKKCNSQISNTFKVWIPYRYNSFEVKGNADLYTMENKHVNLVIYCKGITVTKDWLYMNWEAKEINLINS